MRCNYFLMLIRHDTLWPWPLTPWPWTFVVPRASCVQTLYKIWAKSNNPRQSYWRYRTFSRSSYFLRTVLRGAWTELHQTWRGHRAIMAALGICFRVDISCCIFKCRCLKLSDIENDAKFRTFWPLQKLWEGWASSLGKLLELYLWSNLQYTFDGRTLRVCWMPCHGKKERKKKVQ